MHTGEIRTGVLMMFEPGAETPIASGVLTMNNGLMVVRAQTGTADDLTEFAVDPDYSAGAQAPFYLKAAIGHTITIVHNPTTSNIAVRGGSNYVLTGEDFVTVMRYKKTTDAVASNIFIVV